MTGDNVEGPAIVSNATPTQLVLGYYEQGGKLASSVPLGPPSLPWAASLD